MLTTSQTEIVLATLEENDPEIAVKIVKGLIRGFMRDNETAPETEETEHSPDDRASPKGGPTVDPAWYRADINGQTKLSPEGEEHIYSLYDQGVSIYSAAKKMGISYQAAKHRFGSWEKLAAAGKRPNAKSQ
ncbi:hypothetical protein [Microvirga splendida]|uniref:Uncharacterized protein n=1 Tax=Microvirga splendida TaxID=2795727 RepID=A0ABS0Y8C3_9HYPH|nr:hypothetical protein [Microvirga splendida]MBJ6128560.1 hypothetical protein [Microvirga splendida]